jgi:hypothetical protein
MVMLATDTPLWEEAAAKQAAVWAVLATVVGEPEVVEYELGDLALALEVVTSAWEG